MMIQLNLTTSQFYSIEDDEEQFYSIEDDEERDGNQSTQDDMIISGSIANLKK